MADWNKILSRGNIEDRRGSPMALAGGGLGLVGVGIVLVLQLLSGGPVDVGSVLQQLQATNTPSSLNAKDFEGEDNYERFASTVLGSNNDYWAATFEQSGKKYDPPRLVLFRSATQSGCGIANSQVGPHYCPADSTIYIDETFFDALTKRLKAKGGDVAEAYVIAHEVGHHVQYQLALVNESSQSNEDSIRLELQADCFAGLWAKSISSIGVFEPGEINEAQDAAASIGDDRIQEKVQGRINPESWTHGSSAQRVQWFNTGLESGEPAKCAP